MGRVNHQPVSIHSFTNKRFTVNFRAPINQVQKLLPAAIEPDEINETGLRPERHDRAARLPDDPSPAETLSVNYDNQKSKQASRHT
jgi:hypothetical protein